MLRTLLLTVALLVGLESAAVAHGSFPTRTPTHQPSGSSTRPPREIVGYVAPRMLSASEAARYAERDAASLKAKRYRGGDAVVIVSASALAVILAVVLLIVLL